MGAGLSLISYGYLDAGSVMQMKDILQISVSGAFQ